MERCRGSSDIIGTRTLKPSIMGVRSGFALARTIQEQAKADQPCHGSLDFRRAF